MTKFSSALSVAIVMFSSTWSMAQVAPVPQPARQLLFSQTSIEKGWQTAMHKKRPMLVMFTTDNCRFCKKMLAETYGHPAIQQMLAANTQTVLAHADDYQALVKKLGIRGYPSSVLISPKGEVIDYFEGYVPPQEFAKRVVPLLRPQVQQPAPTRQASYPVATSK